MEMSLEQTGEAGAPSKNQAASLTSDSEAVGMNVTEYISIYRTPVLCWAFTSASPPDILPRSWCKLRFSEGK